MRNFLIWCAGASPQLISECTEADALRQKIIGSLVILTGVFAWLGSFYAFYSTSNNLLMAMFGSLIWASFIFTLDRMIVSSIHPVRRGNDYVLSPLRLFPRIVLAILIGATLSKPFELYLFRAEIIDEIIEGHKEKIKQRSSEDKLRSEAQKEEIDRLCGLEVSAEKLNNLRGEIASLQIQIDSTIHGTDGRLPTCGRVCRDLIGLQNPLRDTLASEIDKLEECNKREKKRLDKEGLAEKKFIESLRSDEDGAVKNPSFLSQYRVLEELSANNNEVMRASFFLFFLFAFIEIVPILAKLSSGVSGYELAVFRQRLNAIEKTNEHIFRIGVFQSRQEVERNRDVEIFQEEVEKSKEIHRWINGRVQSHAYDGLSSELSELDRLGGNNDPRSDYKDMLAGLLRAKLGRLLLLDPWSQYESFSRAQSSGVGINSEARQSPPKVRAEVSMSDLNSGLASAAPPMQAAGSDVLLDQVDGGEGGAEQSTPAPLAARGLGVKGWLQGNANLFVKKAIESLAAKTPDLLVFLCSNNFVFIAAFSTSLVGLVSVAQVTLYYAVPVLFAFFFFARRGFGARNSMQKSVKK